MMHCINSEVFGYKMQDCKLPSRSRPGDTYAVFPHFWAIQLAVMEFLTTWDYSKNTITRGQVSWKAGGREKRNIIELEGTEKGQAHSLKCAGDGMSWASLRHPDFLQTWK